MPSLFRTVVKSTLLLFILMVTNNVGAVQENHGVMVAGDLTITTADNGVTLVQTGNGKIVLRLSAQTIQTIKDLGIAESAVGNFFTILQQGNIPFSAWDHKLREIADSYLKLKAKVAALDVTAVHNQDLKVKVQAAIDQGRFDEAEDLLNQIRARHQQSAESSLPQLRKYQALIKQGLTESIKASLANAELMNTRFHYRKAGDYYLQASKTVEQLKAHIPGDYDDELAVPLTEVADKYYDAALYALAEPLYQRSLALKEQVHGLEHPLVADTLNNLAELYRTQGLYAQAEPLYQRSLKIQEKSLGPEHPSVATTLNNLARLYQAQGLYAQAEPLYQRSIGILEKIFPNGHPNLESVRRNYAHLQQL